MTASYACSSSAATAPAVVPISGQTLSRADVLALLERGTGPLHFEQCDFEGADLSRLDLRGVQFTECALAEVSFEKSNLADSRWLGCRSGLANFHLADLSDARWYRCDL